MSARLLNKLMIRIFMLRDYLKIISAILAAMLTLIIFMTAAILFFEEMKFTEAVGLSMGFALAGFLFFGITGSVIWVSCLSIVRRHSLNLVYQHGVSALVATGASFLIFFLAMSGGDLRQLLSALRILIFVVPAVTLSLFWYWLFYLRGRAT